MSLLLDALKRAEQEKQARQEPGAAKPALELAPIGGPGRPASGTPASPTGATATPATPPPMKSTPPAARSRKGLWIAGVAVLVLILGGAGYVWYSITSLSPQVARVPAVRPLPPPPAVSVPVPAQIPVTQAEPPTPLPPLAQPARAENRPAPAVSETPRAAPAPSAVLQPTRSADRPRIAPEVAAAYDALRRGDLGTAKRDYSAALAADPSNLDATLGLATVEARGGRMDVAVILYRRALEIDPRNATAFAGLAALADLTRPDALEMQLGREIAQNPNSASLHFMLGNVYAAQSLWSQAQAAYFEAHRLEPGNADFVHNLAVSLDRIGQPRLAATMYRRALEGARSQSTQFDTAAVQRRLAELEAPR